MTAPILVLEFCFFPFTPVLLFSKMITTRKVGQVYICRYVLQLFGDFEPHFYHNCHIKPLNSKYFFYNAAVGRVAFAMKKILLSLDLILIILSSISNSLSVTKENSEELSETRTLTMLINVAFLLQH